MTRDQWEKLEGLIENVIVGHKIPAGTGLFDGKEVIVGSQEEIDNLESDKDFVDQKSFVNDHELNDVSK